MFIDARSKNSPFFIPLLAGMSARVISVTVVSPLELIRTKMQSQRLSYFGKIAFSCLNDSTLV